MKLIFVRCEGDYSIGDIIEPDMPGVAAEYLRRGICKVYEPEHVIILDPVLLKTVNVTQGLKSGGWMLINSDLPPGDFKFPSFKVATVDATGIAIKYRLGPKTAPIVNTAILGAFVRLTKMARIENIYASIPEYAPVKLDENVKATGDAYEMVRS